MTRPYLAQRGTWKLERCEHCGGRYAVGAEPRIRLPAHHCTDWAQRLVQSLGVPVSVPVEAPERPVARPEQRERSQPPPRQEQKRDESAGGGVPI